VRLGQGRENAKDFLREHPEIMSDIEKGIRARIDSGGSASPPAAVEHEGAGEPQ
jgi:recombination protein RecA